MYKSTWTLWRRRSTLLAVAIACAVAVAGCANSTPTTAKSATDRGAVSTAKTTVTSAISGVVSAQSIKEPLAAVSAFNGPTTAEPKGPSSPNMIGVASCADPCNYVGNLVGSIGKQTDAATYDGSIGNGPQDWQQLTTEAINADPKVIVFNGVADGSVIKQVAAARAKGIKTVGVSVEKSVPADQGYDAYVSVRQDVSYRLMLTTAIADSNGKANVVLFEPSGYASTDNYVQQAKSEFNKECPGCSLTVQQEDTASLVDPTKMDQLVTSALNAHPNANYILFGDDFYALSAAQTAVKRENRDVTMIAQDGSAPGLAAVKAGILKYDAGVPLEWIAYAGYDAIRRVLTGQPALPPNGWGGGAHLWTAKNLPSKIDDQSADAVWNKLVDYQSGYNKLWKP